MKQRLMQIIILGFVALILLFLTDSLETELPTTEPISEEQEEYVWTWEAERVSNPIVFATTTPSFVVGAYYARVINSTLINNRLYNNYEIFAIDKTGTKESVIATIHDPGNYISEFQYAPQSGHIIIFGGKRVDLIHPVLRTIEPIYVEDGGTVWGVATNKDATRILVGRDDGFYSTTGDRLYSFVKVNGHYERTEIQTKLPIEWRNGFLHNNHLISNSAPWRMGAYTPFIDIVNLTTLERVRAKEIGVLDTEFSERIGSDFVYNTAHQELYFSASRGARKARHCEIEEGGFAPSNVIKRLDLNTMVIETIYDTESLLGTLSRPVLTSDGKYIAISRSRSVVDENECIIDGVDEQDVIINVETEEIMFVDNMKTWLEANAPLHTNTLFERGLIFIGFVN